MVAKTPRDGSSLIARHPGIVRLARVAAIAVGSVAAFVAWRWETGNLGEVEPKVVFRSAQLGPKEFGRVVRTQGIKTVLNLRGRNPNAKWYRLERDAVLKAGATHVDFSMASDMWLSRSQAHALIDVLQKCNYPILIHCEWGSERTGLVSAIVALARPGGSIERARRQFSSYYLFVPDAHGRTMRGMIDHYQSSLEARHVDHSPEEFKRWLIDDYRPRGPSREDWPYNPYPLVEIERPGGGERVTILERSGARSR